jgi:DNA (cytosine-5)-methyltransferase 1
MNGGQGRILMPTSHVPGTLSELERRMEVHIPPGGNWTHIPEDIPSDRLAQIREMTKRRGMCRTTYYGRLHPDRPSYTINTYFSRLGNGTHLHYDTKQHRLMSIREAARYQSFPDRFEFQGPKTSQFTQIGNAVPPLLAYQISSHLGLAGYKALDLFCGAGGMSYGLNMAGVEVEVGVDNSKHAMSTYAENHSHSLPIIGNLKQADIMSKVISSANSLDVDLITGGPPCQGFSIAGWRDPNDEKNKLFRQFHTAVEALQPKIFIMENVPGITSADKGKTFATITKSFEDLDYELTIFKLKADQYGIPQRRTRVFVVGSSTGQTFSEPEPLTNKKELHPWITCEEAVGDLPATVNDIDVNVPYKCPAQSEYQKLMRDEILPSEYLDSLKDWEL